MYTLQQPHAHTLKYVHAMDTHTHTHTYTRHQNPCLTCHACVCALVRACVFVCVFVCVCVCVRVQTAKYARVFELNPTLP